MKEPEFSRPPAPSMLIALCDHADDHRVIFFDDGFKLPSFCPHEPMCRGVGIICLGPKPGEADGDSATDRLAIRPPRFRTQKKHFITAPWLPGGHLCAVQVHLGLAEGRSDLHSRHRAIALANSGNPWNSEPAVQL